MAKLDIYGSSPNCSSLFNDWTLTTEPFCNSEFGIVDPDPIELFEDLNDWPPSIFSDIKKIQSDVSASSGSINGGDDAPYADFFEPELKPEIRNIDCMWSAQPSSSASSTVLGGAGVGVGVGVSIAAGTVGTTAAAVTTAVPLAAVIENAQNISNNKQQQQQQQQQQRVNNNKLPQFVATAGLQIKVESIKEETIDNDYEQQLLQHSIPNNKVQQQRPQPATQCMQQIKPGMSLLRKSNLQQQQQQQQQKKQQLNKHNGVTIKIPAKTTAEFLRERDQTAPAIPPPPSAAATSTPSATKLSAARPDTPLSLDDDPVAPEFKHNVDLRACVMGSNNISLVSSDPNNIINHLSEQLQDTSKNRIDLRSLMPDTGCDFADVLDLIVKDDRSMSSASSALLNGSLSSNCSSSSSGGGVFSFGSSSANNNKRRATATTTTTTAAAAARYTSQHRSFESDDDEDVGDYYDYIEDEEEDEYDDFGSTCGSATSASSSLLNRSLSSTAGGLSNSSSSSHSAMSSAYGSATSPLSSACSVIGGGGGGGGGGGQASYPTTILHSDHSYTRCNDDLGTNLETPSDSDEEIDVVSIGDKKLPTNPSDRDRRALQHKVAHKFSNARIVKTANGVRTIPPRRRITVELPYTPASSSPVKSVANSRYPSPSTTPYHNQYTSKYVQQQTQHMLSVMSSGSGRSNASTGGGGEKQRKRIALAPPMAAISSSAAGVAAAAGIAAAAAAATRGGRGGGAGGSSSASLADYLPPSKKHRNSKKLQQQQQQYAYNTLAAAAAGSAVAGGVGGDIVKRHYSLDETADTLEKRSLHNDMERQRRIGLKNLFEALKKQIPSIRDKERAPKVNILREAAKLCEALTREDQQLNEHKAILKEQLRKKQELLARLRMSIQED